MCKRGLALARKLNDQKTINQLQKGLSNYRITKTYAVSLYNIGTSAGNACAVKDSIKLFHKSIGRDIAFNNN